MIETHVHFNSEPLYTLRRECMARAEAVGVNTFWVIGYDRESSERAIQIAEEDARCFAVIGLHPQVAPDWNVEAERWLREWASHPRVVAIGEIGLDFYTGQNNERNPAPVAVQERAFREQLTLAQDSHLPVIIHCRDAYEETLTILERDAGETPVILHCFAGTKAQAERAFAQSWYLGIGGTVTYKRNDELREIVRVAPSELLLLETDAPYLSPEPLRGKFPNEPSRIPLIVERIAAIRNQTVSEVVTDTTKNATRIAHHHNNIAKE